VPIFKITIAYDGTNYCGWQVQVNGPTVQAAIEKSLAQITGQRIRVTGSGRTDSGVHAIAQVAGFQCDKALEPADWKRALNGQLPNDIRITDVQQLQGTFDPIRDCAGKRYRYVICDGPIHDVFLRQYRWHVRLRIDERRMHEAGQALVGRHDFASFQGAGSPRATTVRTIRELTVERCSVDLEEVRLEVEADGFLYNMVRNIVGVLVDVGHRKLDVDDVAGILAERDRGKARRTAPPEGLFLVRVDY
jgi:tRNA pseudouridine38-40 synthase